MADTDNGLLLCFAPSPAPAPPVQAECKIAGRAINAAAIQGLVLGCTAHCSSGHVSALHPPPSHRMHPPHHHWGSKNVRVRSEEHENALLTRRFWSVHALIARAVAAGFAALPEDDDEGEPAGEQSRGRGVASLRRPPAGASFALCALLREPLRSRGEKTNQPARPLPFGLSTILSLSFLLLLLSSFLGAMQTRKSLRVSTFLYAKRLKWAQMADRT